MDSSIIIGIACILLLLIVLYELFYNRTHTEGFLSGSNNDNNSNFLEEFYPKRTDIIPGKTVEDNDWIRDVRYKEQYVDVQKIGIKNDLCRVVMKRDNPGTMIMACALAGTDGTPSRNYATLSKAKGFVFSRDDYFRENADSKRADYCRIVKTELAPDDKWQARCAPGGNDMFLSKEILDNDPPKNIVDLLWFFEGIMIWYRFKDDMLDYAQNTQLAIAGNIQIDQDPLNNKTEGLKINPVYDADKTEGSTVATTADQFLRIGENSELEFDQKVELRNLRSFMFWVKFDKFTNNAHIFDFGNGSGHDNIYFGIEGAGNTVSTNKEKPLSSQVSDANIVCQSSAPRELDPRVFMKYTEANVELYDCPGPEPIAHTTDVNLPPPKRSFSDNKKNNTKKANILFEIWDKEQRKMRIRCIDALQEGKLHHVACTVTDMSFRPTWKVYVDGINIFTLEEGHLGQANYTTKNYIGRSNWEAIEGTYSDERFRGTLFDFRMYRIPLSETKILKSIEWGKNLLSPQVTENYNLDEA
jgi:hypothetical protein